MIKYGTKEIKRRAIEMKFVNHIRFSFKIGTGLNLIALVISRFYTWSDQIVSANFVVVFINYKILQNRRRRWRGAPPPPPPDNFWNCKTYHKKQYIVGKGI